MHASLWEFIYERPRVRIGWLAGTGRLPGPGRSGAWRQGSVALANLEIGNAGLWPHVVLPVTGANVKVLPDLVLALLEATRGGSVEIMPAGFMPTRLSRGDVPDRGDRGGALPLTPPARTKPLRRGEGPALSPGDLSRMGGDERHSPDAKARPGPSERAPASHWERQRLTGLNRDDTNPASVEEHVGALMEIYRNPRIPLRLVSPLSWVAARVGSQAALVGSDRLRGRRGGGAAKRRPLRRGRGRRPGALAAGKCSGGRGQHPLGTAGCHGRGFLECDAAGRVQAV